MLGEDTAQPLALPEGFLAEPKRVRAGAKVDVQGLAVVVLRRLDAS